MTNELPTLATTDLEQVSGGLDIGSIASQLGGLADSFTGGQGKGAQLGGQIGGWIQQLIGNAGGGGGGQQSPDVTASVTTG